LSIKLDLDKTQRAIIISAWIILCGLLFTGVITVNAVGQIEISAILAFAIVLLCVHLVKILFKKTKD